MADEARSRLGRGLAALIGDVGDESRRRSSARAAQRARADRVPASPTRAIRAASSPKPSSTSWPHRSASAASSSRSWCAPCAARPINTRSSPASGAGARRSAPACTTCRSSARGQRPRGARACDHRERAARRPQPAGRGGRLSGARRRVQHSQDDIADDRRQEPQPCRQHAAAAEAARAVKAYHRATASSPPAMRAR